MKNLDPQYLQKNRYLSIASALSSKNANSQKFFEKRLGQHSSSKLSGLKLTEADSSINTNTPESLRLTHIPKGPSK